MLHELFGGGKDFTHKAEVNKNLKTRQGKKTHNQPTNIPKPKHITVSSVIAEKFKLCTFLSCAPSLSMISVYFIQQNKGQAAREQ